MGWYFLQTKCFDISNKPIIADYDEYDEWRHSGHTCMFTMHLTITNTAKNSLRHNI